MITTRQSLQIPNPIIYQPGLVEYYSTIFNGFIEESQPLRAKHNHFASRYFYLWQLKQRLISLVELRFEHAEDVHVTAGPVVEHVLAQNAFQLKANTLHQAQ